MPSSLLAIVGCLLLADAVTIISFVMPTPGGIALLAIASIVGGVISLVSSFVD